MTTPRGQKHRLRPDVAAAIERAWPDGVIEMCFDSEESWFWDVHPKLAGAFHRLHGASLLYQHEAEETRSWTDEDDDDDDPPCPEPSRSYHLFFVAPQDDAFTFETTTETEAEPEFDEYGHQEFDSDAEMITVPGRGHTGWSVAVSLIAPFAAISLSDYAVFEDGSNWQPAIRRYVEDNDGNPVNPEDAFREAHGQQLFQKLDKLRTRIVSILEKHGVTVLPEAELHKAVPWLKGDGEALVGDAVNQPISVFDAFFFEGI